MDDNKRLYPLKFVPEAVEKPWGREVYAVADLGYADSVAVGGFLSGNSLSELMQVYLEKMVGESAFEWYGTQFPVMVKWLHLSGSTPLMVNPDDETAEQRYDAFGKTALWYICEAAEDAKLYLGFRRELTAAELYDMSRDGGLEEALNVLTPHRGDCYLLSPGMVYAASGNMRILEISESSELAFQLYRWGRWDRDTELQLTEALDIVRLSPGEETSHPHVHEGEAPVTECIAKTPQFTVTRVRLTDALHIYSERFGSFVLYTCVSGEASLQVPSVDAGGTKGMDEWTATEGDTVLVPADVPELYIVPRSPDTLFLETVLERRELPDSYVGDEPHEHDDCGCGHHHHHHHD